MCGSCGVYYMERVNGFIYSHHTTLSATREFCIPLIFEVHCFQLVMIASVLKSLEKPYIQGSVILNSLVNTQSN